MKKIILILFIATSLASCSKEDCPTTPTIQNFKQANFGNSIFSFDNDLDIVQIDIQEYGGFPNMRQIYISGALDGREAQTYITIHSDGETFTTGKYNVMKMADVTVPSPPMAYSIFQSLRYNTNYTAAGGTLTVSKIETNTYTLILDMIYTNDSTNEEVRFTGTIKVSPTIQ